MRFVIAAVMPRKLRMKSSSAQALFEEYVQRSGRYVAVEAAFFESEAALLESARRSSGRTAAFVVLLDSRGKGLSSTDLASKLGQLRDGGTQQVVFAVGPADGWSAKARAGADMLLSLGGITLPHELALVVLAEQVYRGLTILAGHPYHSGH